VRYLRLVLLLAVIVVLIVRLNSTPPASTPAIGKLKIAATIFPLADWLREVAGPDAEVLCLVSSGQNPHHFQPTMKDITSLSQSRALFAVGLELDPWAQNLAANAGPKIELQTTGDWVSAMKMREAREIEIHGKDGEDHDEDEHHHHHGSLDPHFWLDPARAIIVVNKMAEILGRLDPAHSAGYTQRAVAYVENLQKLNEEISVLKSKIPPKKEIVTFHDAYGYLFDRLGITISAVVQVAPGVEPSVKDMADAISVMKAIGQRIVFQEPGSNTTATAEIAKELGATVETLDPIEVESSDTGKTYIERLRHDLKAIGNLVEK
jgi:ABC-type Zn uptake system ZnuABC Zn-binding protein ZnuA